MLYQTAGTRLLIADEPTGRAGPVPDAGWVEIGETEGLGLLGVEWKIDSAEIAESSNPRDHLVVWHSKRARLVTPMQLVIGNDPDDPGQVILWRAALSTDHYPFRLEFSESGFSRTWLAQVTSISEVYDRANAVQRLQVTLIGSDSFGILRSEV